MDYTEERPRRKWWIWPLVIFIILIILVATFFGIEYFRHRISKLHGTIFGNEYIIDTFDNNGIKTMTTRGTNIDISANEINKNVDMNGDSGQYETLSSVITITIDGRQIISCGDTCIFYDKSLKPDYEFYLDNIDSHSSGGLDQTTLISGRLNSIRNYIGKPMVVVIKSQTGAPIYVFSGKSVYWEISQDLPKFTLISIDGKPLYIHRANFQIIDASLLDK